MHDLSKYSLTEFRVGVNYYQGDRSPNTAERSDLGYSTAWLHHKGRNRHHYEYWIDMKGNRDATLEAKPMPTRLEQSAKGELLMHPDTKALLERMLTWLAEDGEEIALRRVRNEIVKPRHREPNTPKF